MKTKNSFFLNKDIENHESFLHQLEIKYEQTNLNSYFEGFRFDDFFAPSYFSFDINNPLALITRLREFIRKLPEGERLNLLTSDTFKEVIDSFLTNLNEEERLQLIEFSTALVGRYICQLDLKRQINRAQKHINFLKKQKERPIAIDKRASIRNNSKNNLYRKSDDGDHMLTPNLNNLIQSNYGLTSSHKHHDTTIYCTDSERHRYRANFERVTFIRKRQAAPGVC